MLSIILVCLWMLQLNRADLSPMKNEEKLHPLGKGLQLSKNPKLPAALTEISGEGMNTENDRRHGGKGKGKGRGRWRKGKGKGRGRLMGKWRGKYLWRNLKLGWGSYKFDSFFRGDGYWVKHKECRSEYSFKHGQKSGTTTGKSNGKPQAQCVKWRDQLYCSLGARKDGNQFQTVVLIQNNKVNIECNDPKVANAICRLNKKQEFRCGKHTWYTGVCKGGFEISVDQKICTCGKGVSLRPCVGDSSWGGFGKTCNAPTQNITLFCNDKVPKGYYYNSYYYFGNGTWSGY